MPSTWARTVVSRNQIQIPWRSASAAEIHCRRRCTDTWHFHSPVPQTVGLQPKVFGAFRSAAISRRLARVRSTGIRRAAFAAAYRSHGAPERRRRPGDRSASRRRVAAEPVVIAHTRSHQQRYRHRGVHFRAERVIGQVLLTILETDTSSFPDTCSPIPGFRTVKDTRGLKRRTKTNQDSLCSSCHGRR